MNWKRLALPALLACLMTGLNALKPPVIDDTAYLNVARQIAAHPLDPYGFEQFWYNAPEPANHVLAPPVVPAWIGLGIKLFGDDPAVLKFWLFPFAFLLMVALQSLLTRFARGSEAPLLVLTACAPAVLPAFNFMIDLPSLSLSLAALCMYLRTLARHKWLLVIAAGILAGLAMQTKYIAMLTPVLFIVATTLRFRRWYALAAVPICWAIFAGWEWFVWAKYGESHFLYALRSGSIPLRDKLDLAPWFFSLLGGVGVPLLILARGRSRLLVAVAAIAVLIAHLSMGRLEYIDWQRVFGAMGIATLVSVAVLALTHAVVRRRRTGRFFVSRPDLFLILWMGLEFAGYLGMSPFPAVRRLIGFTLAGTLFVGRLQRRHWRHRPIDAWLAVVPGVLMGIAFAAIDITNARVEPLAVRTCYAWIRERDPAGRIWYVGHWGFQYEADRLGMQALAARRSHVKPGDWLIVPDAGQNQQLFTRDSCMGEPLARIQIENRFPRRTLPPFYGGELAIVPASPLRLEVTVYRITEDWFPR